MFVLSLPVLESQSIYCATENSRGTQSMASGLVSGGFSHMGTDRKKEAIVVGPSS